MVARGGKRGGKILKNVGAAVFDGGEFAVHLPVCAYNLAAELLANGLMTEANA
jgi:hypothetical protein